MEYSTSSLIHQLNIEMNRVADRMLRNHISLSYSRFYFLFHIFQSKSLSQHDLAVAMGYSDPAVSRMLAELSGAGLVEAVPDPQHKRRRIARLTTNGTHTVHSALDLLDNCFADAIGRTNVDEGVYARNTAALIEAMKHKNKESL